MRKHGANVTLADVRKVCGTAVRAVNSSFAPQVTGRTALHWACIGKEIDVVRVLLRYRAPVDLPDVRGAFGVLHVPWSIG